MDGYRVQAIIDACETIGNGILDLCEKARSVIDNLGDNEEQTQGQPKDERDWRE